MSPDLNPAENLWMELKVNAWAQKLSTELEQLATEEWTIKLKRRDPAELETTTRDCCQIKSQQYTFVT